MTCSEAMAALDCGDEAKLVTFTVEDVHLKKRDVHWVMLALFQCRKHLARMGEADNPTAYVHRVAKRLKCRDEEQFMGRHTVYDEDGSRPIGSVVVGSYFNREGALIDYQHGGQALGFQPAPGIDGVAEVGKSARERRVERHNAKPMVGALDDDERAVQKAQRQGISRREIAGVLGWDQRRVERTWKRLHRRLRAQMSPDATTHASEGKTNL